MNCDQFPIGSRRREICAGTSGLTLAKTNSFRKKYDLPPLAAVESIQRVPVIHAGAQSTKIKRVNNSSNRQCVTCRVAPPQGPGTELLSIWKKAGAASCQLCCEYAKKMDEWGVEGCRKRIDEIVEDVLPRVKQWLAEKKTWTAKLYGSAFDLSGALTPAASFLTGRELLSPDDRLRKRIRDDVNKAIDASEVESRQRTAGIVQSAHRAARFTGRQYPVQPVEFQPQKTLRWAACFTVSVRKQPSWQRAVGSCIDAGWNPVCFAEPDVKESKIDGMTWVQRPETISPTLFQSLGPRGLFGAFQNYLQALSDTLALQPDAEMILYAQDDAVFPPGAKSFLESIIWPDGVPLLSLWCPSGHGYERTSPGICRTPKADIIGAIAFVMPRATAEWLVTSAFMRDWQGNKQKDNGPKRRILDIATGRALETIGKHTMYFTHSIADHFEPVPGNSSIGNGPNVGFRKSHKYVGDSASAAEIMKTYGGTEAHSGEQRVPTERPTQPDPVLVIIPGYGLPDVTTACLDALAKSTVPLKLMYVDNGSEVADYERVLFHTRSLFPAAMIGRYEENRGFTCAINLGLEVVPEGHHALILNNDCRVQPDTIANMLAELSGDKIASVCPVTNDNGRCSLKRQENIRIREHQTSRQSDVLPWFCCLLNRDALSIVDQLPTDDAMASGLGVDDWWSLQLRRHGWSHLITGKAFAEHDHSQTFKAAGIDRDSEQRKAIEWLAKN